MNVLVVVVTYNASGIVDNCLGALDHLISKSEHRVQVVVVDNASTDDTVALVRRQAPWALIVDSGENLGFGRGANLGVQHGIGYDAVLLLNPDAQLSVTDFNGLVAYLESDPTIGAVAPAMILPGGQRGISGGPRPTVTKEILAAWGVDRVAGPRARKVLARGAGRWPGLGRGLLRYLATTAPNTEPLDLDWVSGFCCLVRAEAWHQVEGFDPEFFLYYEDVDLCLRLRQAGWAVRCLTSAACFHDESASTRSAGKSSFQRDGFRTFLQLHGTSTQRLAAKLLVKGA